MISPVTTLRVPQAAIEVTPTVPNRMQQNDWCKVGSSNQPEDINGGYRCIAAHRHPVGSFRLVTVA